MKFENKPITFNPRPLFEDKDFQERLFEKKREIVDAYRPNESDFTDLYPAAEINEDLKEVARLEALYKEKELTEKEVYLEKISAVYEAVIADQISQNAWFGEDCDAVPASRFDDIKNGVDVITVFKKDNETQYMGMGVDVTFSSDEKVLEKKLESIKDRIRSHSLPFVKYFTDPATGAHKNLFIPKVIVGSRLSSAEKLIRLWGGTDKDKNKKLAEHPVSSKLIMETLAQLMYFYQYATELSVKTLDEKDREKYKEIALGYATVYNIFYDLYENKKDMINSHLNEISDDIVYETILKFTTPRE